MSKMALVSDGQYVLCDGNSCGSRVNLPIALRPLLSGRSTVDQLKGWLFVTVDGYRRHYCPNCVPQYLEDMNLVDDK